MSKIVKIDYLEFCPIYDISNYGFDIEVTEEELDKINKIFNDFVDIQKLLREKLKENKRNQS